MFLSPHIHSCFYESSYSFMFWCPLIHSCFWDLFIHIFVVLSFIHVFDSSYSFMFLLVFLFIMWLSPHIHSCFSVLLFLHVLGTFSFMSFLVLLFLHVFEISYSFMFWDLLFILIVLYIKSGITCECVYQNVFRHAINTCSPPILQVCLHKNIFSRRQSKSEEIWERYIYIYWYYPGMFP